MSESWRQHGIKLARSCSGRRYAVEPVGCRHAVSSGRIWTMVAQSRRPVRGLTFACSLLAMLAGAQSAPAAADGSEGTQFGRTEPCIVGHRFEPGPIVGGHYRQPTQAEFEARKRELLARSQGSGGRCSAPPLSSTTGASDAEVDRPRRDEPEQERACIRPENGGEFLSY
jgi:hypothetical protein